MQLSIPEGAELHIVVRGGSPQALLPPPAATVPEQSAARPRRPILTGALAVALAFGSFEVGRFVSGKSGSVPAARAASFRAPPLGAPLGADVEQTSATASDGSVPSAFQKQLAQPPELIPPPGQGPTKPAAPASTPFGLHE